MAKKQFRALALLLAVFAFSSILLVACTRPGTASTSGNNGTTASSTSGSSSSGSCASGDTVKTGATTFEQTCINLTKGATLKITPDVSSYHILDYGQWSGSTAQATPAPAGAPTMKGLTLTSTAVNIGPFTTAGTYHIYCTVHTGMDLTVNVK